MSRLSPMLIALSLGCADPNAGTAVGNPGDGMTVRLAPPPALMLDRGEIQQSLVSMVNCQGVSTVVHTGLIELVETPFIPLPAGSWCGVTMDIGIFDADFSGAASANVQLQSTPIPVVTGAPFDSTGLFILQLGGPSWPALDLLAGGDVRPGDVAHDSLVQSLFDDSIFFRDVDSDGEFTDADEVVAAGDPTRYGLPEPEDDDDD